MSLIWLLVILEISSATKDYPVTWIARGVHEYFIYNGSLVVNHAKALKICEEMDSHLVMPTTDELHRDVKDVIKQIGYKENGPPYRSYYIGLHDYSGGNSNFQWINGDFLHFISGTPMQWSDGEPNDFNSIAEDCVTMGSFASQNDYKWFDVPCVAKRWYICQRIIGEAVPNVNLGTYLMTSALIFFILSILLATALVHRRKFTHVKLVAEPPMAPYTDNKTDKEDEKKVIDEVLITKTRKRDAVTIENTGAVLEV
ncbi:uncharacterized protein LOC120344523 [Styela clava]